MILNYTLLAACQQNSSEMVPDFGYEWQRATMLDMFEQKRENVED